MSITASKRFGCEHDLRCQWPGSRPDLFGQLGRERDALLSIEQAERSYPSHPEQDPSFLYAEFRQASLILEKGLAFLALAEKFPGRSYQRTAANVFDGIEWSTPATRVPDRIRYEIINHRAWAAILLSDLETAESHLRHAVDGFASLDSRQRRQEAQTAWTRAVERWPHERRRVALGDRLREL